MSLLSLWEVLVLYSPLTSSPFSMLHFFGLVACCVIRMKSEWSFLSFFLQGVIFESWYVIRLSVYKSKPNAMNWLGIEEKCGHLQTRSLTALKAVWVPFLRIGSSASTKMSTYWHAPNIWSANVICCGLTSTVIRETLSNRPPQMPFSSGPLLLIHLSILQ